MICIIGIVARGYNKLLVFIIQNYYNNKAIKTRVHICMLYSYSHHPSKTVQFGLATCRTMNGLRIKHYNWYVIEINNYLYFWSHADKNRVPHESSTTITAGELTRVHQLWKCKNEYGKKEKIIQNDRASTKRGSNSNFITVFCGDSY